jgi:cell division protein FtsZ
MAAEEASQFRTAAEIAEDTDEKEDDVFTGEHVSEGAPQPKETFEEAVAATRVDDFSIPPLEQDKASLRGNMVKRPTEDAEARSAAFSEEEVMEERAVAEQEMQGAFVADAPMTPKTDQGYAQGQANIFQEAAYASGAKDKATSVEDSADETGYEAIEPARAEPAAEPAKPEPKRSLFQLMTAGLRGGNEAQAKAQEELERSPSNDRGGVRMNSIVKKEPSIDKPAQSSAAPQTTVGGVSDEDRPVAAKPAKDQLEIPSFLKRQQN